MDTNTFVSKMGNAGDAYVYYKSPVSGKIKYHICTAELDNNKYIQDKLSKKSFVVQPKEGQLKVFCWDLDDFKNLDLALVTQVTPLSSVIINN